MGKLMICIIIQNIVKYLLKNVDPLVYLIDLYTVLLFDILNLGFCWHITFHYLTSF